MELDSSTRAFRGGGTLLRVKQDDLDAVEMDEGQFFSSVMVVNK
jgi:hypothetical protein